MSDREEEIINRIRALEDSEWHIQRTIKLLKELLDESKPNNSK